MADKTNMIMRKMKLRRDQILKEFNASTLDDVGPVGGTEQGPKLLSEMKSLVDDHKEFVKSLAPGVDG